VNERTTQKRNKGYNNELKIIENNIYIYEHLHFNICKQFLRSTYYLLLSINILINEELLV